MREMKTDNGGGGSRTTWAGKPAKVGDPGDEPINPTTQARDRHETIEVVRRNWRAEVETAQVYRELAERERDEKRKGILLRMAEAEERHAQRWEKKLIDLGEPVPTLPDTISRRLKRWLNRALGTEIAIRRMEAAEEKHEAQFRDQRDRALADEHDVKDFLRESALEEKAHARALNAMVPQLGPRTVLDTILKRERWHGRGGSWVADAIYGVNDGLGAVFGIVSGVAGATNNQQHYILISGLAGMIASSLSMGAGAYLAVKSEGEVYEAEIAREKAEVEENPEEEIEEMALFYQLQGFNPEESQRMAERLAEQPEQMVQAMAQSELGLSQHHGGKPWTSAMSAALSTAIGAFIPIIPFFFMSGLPAIIAAFAISILAHFAVGALKSLITIRSWWASGLEMTFVGVIEAAVTYSLGLAFGALG
jgi:VIT1/CCC1 family predicted Fe2+/Mn2+ transporter/rubrerythrin